jgi:hypothetical protein
MDSVKRSDWPLARIATVVGKELVDMFRDRRTALVTLLSAIAAGPLFLVLIFNLIANQADRARDLKLPVAGREHAPALAAFLERQQVVLTAAPADYEAQIRRGCTTSASSRCRRPCSTSPASRPRRSGRCSRPTPATAPRWLPPCCPGWASGAT